MLIIPNGIVKENKIYGKRLDKAVLALVVASLNHYLQNKYLQNTVNFISNSPKVVSRLEPLMKNMSTDAGLLRWKCKHDCLSVLSWPLFHRAG